jgi:hypothetical protein
VLVVLIIGVALALDARTAYANLGSAAEDVTALQEQVLAGDREAAAATAAALQESTAAAREALHGPHWDLLAAGPALGENVTAVQVVAQVVDDIAHDSLAALVDATEVVDPAKLAPVDGKIDLDPIVEVAPQVVAADESLQRAQDTLGALDTTVLVDRLRGPVEDLTAQVDELASLTATASRAVQLLPPMLGAEGPREYLLLVQNNAEPRATGGIPGAVVRLRADDGAVRLVEQRSATSLGDFGEPVVEISNVERAMFGTQLARYMHDVTFTPDFPRSAEIARVMWQHGVGTEVDGVLSIDPVALQALLGGSGPVTLSTGHQLTAQNTAQMLLNQVYLDIEDPAAQDEYFAMAASAIFDDVMSGGADPATMVNVLDQIADEGRLMIWSAHSVEQSLIEGTTLSGELVGEVGGSPVIGVYVNDRSAAKIGYYQQVEVEVTSDACRPNGTRQMTFAVTVSSEVPGNFAELPKYLSGGGRSVPEGNVRSDLLVYAPTGGRIVDARSSDDSVTYTPRVHDGLVVGTHKLELAPGSSITLEYDIEVDVKLYGPAVIRLTPGPRGGTSETSTSPCTH